MNCKPGDLAYIVKAPFGGPIGSVVEVEKPFGTEPRFGFAWYVKSSRPIPTRELGYRTDGVVVPDDWMRPISGVPIEDEVTEEITA